MHKIVRDKEDTAPDTGYNVVQLKTRFGVFWSPPVRDHELEVWLENRHATPVVCAAGTIRLGTLSPLYDLTAVAAQLSPARIVFDFSRVATIDSAGLGVVIAARKKLGGHSGCVGVVAQSDQVRGAFELAGLNHCLLSGLDADPRAFDGSRFVAS